MTDTQDPLEIAKDILAHENDVMPPGAQTKMVALDWWERYVIAAPALAQALITANERIEELEKHVYLPLPCPMCGRQRLNWNPTKSQVYCDKHNMDWDDTPQLVEEAEANFEARKALATKDAEIGRLKAGLANDANLLKAKYDEIGRYKEALQSIVDRDYPTQSLKKVGEFAINTARTALKGGTE